MPPGAQIEFLRVLQSRPRKRLRKRDFYNLANIKDLHMDMIE